MIVVAFCLLLLNLCFAHVFVPGEQPASFSVLLLNGSTFSYTVPSTPAHVAPLIVLVFNRNSSIDRHMWTSDASIDDFLRVGSTNASANFLVVSAISASDMSFLKSRFDARVNLLLSHADRQRWRDRVAFAAQPIDSQPGAPFFAPLLNQWNSTAPFINAAIGGGSPLFTFARLDARFDFLPSGARLFGNASLELAYLSNACSNQTSVNVTARVVLTEFSVQCDAYAQAANLIALNALGMLAFDPSSGDMPEINCQGFEECSNGLYGNFFASTIDARAGSKLKSILLSHARAGAAVDLHVKCLDVETPEREDAETVRCAVAEVATGLSSPRVLISFENVVTVGQSFAIDGGNLRLPRGLVPVQGLRETGFFLYPSLIFAAWADQALTYQQRHVDDRVQQLISKSASHLFVPTFAGEKTGTWAAVGTLKNVTLPPASALQRFTRLFLEFELNCWNSILDRECPIWDRIVSIYATCGASPRIELGRWVNNFGRQNGRWITDATAWLPALARRSSNQCTFEVSITSTRFWAPYLNLLFIEDAGVSTKPTQIVPLWPLGYYAFNASYPAMFAPIAINTMPQGVKRIEISALITGHGSDSNGCGEFCNQTHTFWVAPRSSNQQFVTFSASANEAGTAFGCADQVPNGVQPNSRGTWLYGRGMWCNGRQVDPLTFDVTSLLMNGGVIIYNATNDGHAPNGTGGIPSYIDFEAFLTIWT
jgi:hypothetical protein